MGRRYVVGILNVKRKRIKFQYIEKQEKEPSQIRTLYSFTLQSRTLAGTQTWRRCNNNNILMFLLQQWHRDRLDC